MNVKKINSYQSIADAVGALVETAARRWVRVELGHWSEDKQTVKLNLKKFESADQKRFINQLEYP